MAKVLLSVKVRISLDSGNEVIEPFNRGLELDSDRYSTYYFRSDRGKKFSYIRRHLLGSSAY